MTEVTKLSEVFLHPNLQAEASAPLVPHASHRDRSPAGRGVPRHFVSNSSTSRRGKRTEAPFPTVKAGPGDGSRPQCEAGSPAQGASPRRPPGKPDRPGKQLRLPHAGADSGPRDGRRVPPGLRGRARPLRREGVPRPQHASRGATTAVHTHAVEAIGRGPRSGTAAPALRLPAVSPRPAPPTPAIGRTARPAAGSAPLPPRRGCGYPGSPRALSPRSQWLVAGGRVPGRRLPATPAARTDADRRFSRLRFEKCSRVLGGARWTSGDSARSRPRANRSARRGWGRHVGGRGGAPASRAC